MSIKSRGVNIEYDLSAAGHRITKLRSNLINIFAIYKLPLSAADLNAILGKRGVKVHKVTLYRELDFLVEHQVIESVKFDDNVQRFEYVEHPHHHHLVCIRCRKIQDIEDDHEFKGLEAIVKATTKFQILKHSLEFFGLCQDCQLVKAKV